MSLKVSAHAPCCFRCGFTANYGTFNVIHVHKHQTFICKVVRAVVADASNFLLEAHQRNVISCTSIIASIAFWPEGFLKATLWCCCHQKNYISVLQAAYQHLGFPLLIRQVSLSNFCRETVMIFPRGPHNCDGLLMKHSFVFWAVFLLCCLLETAETSMLTLKILDQLDLPLRTLWFDFRSACFLYPYPKYPKIFDKMSSFLITANLSKPKHMAVRNCNSFGEVVLNQKSATSCPLNPLIWYVVSTSDYLTITFGSWPFYSDLSLSV